MFTGRVLINPSLDDLISYVAECHSFEISINPDGFVSIYVVYKSKDNWGYKYITPYKLKDLDALESVFAFIYSELTGSGSILIKLPPDVTVSRGTVVFVRKDLS